LAASRLPCAPPTHTLAPQRPERAAVLVRCAKAEVAELVERLCRRFAPALRSLLTPLAPQRPERAAVLVRCAKAEVAELADAPDSKSGSLRGVWVRFPPSALQAIGLLPVPGPFDEAVLLVAAAVLFAFYREPLRDAWRRAAA
jgi:hypothetical protein